MSLMPQLTSRLRTILRMYWLSSTTRTHSDWMEFSICFFDRFADMRRVSVDEIDLTEGVIGVRFVGGKLARLGSVIVSALHHLARLNVDRHDSRQERGRRHRLEQEFVDAEIDRFDHARPFTMAGEHDDRDVGQRKVARRTHPPHELRSIGIWHFPIENDDIRRANTN